jgi:hypothetical protein
MQIATRIGEVRFESLLFVATPESVASTWCQHELEAAQRLRIPMFALRTGALTLPKPLAARRAVNVSEPATPDMFEALAALADSIRLRAMVWGVLHLLCHPESPEEQRLACHWLLSSADATALSEQLAKLNEAWLSVTDPKARETLLGAVERLRSSDLRQLLLQWREREEILPERSFAILDGLQALLDSSHAEQQG